MRSIQVLSDHQVLFNCRCGSPTDGGQPAEDGGLGTGPCQVNNDPVSRQKTWPVPDPYRRADGPLNLLIRQHRTIKFLGDGEWQGTESNGVRGPTPNGRKVHLAMDHRHIEHPRCGVYAKQRTVTVRFCGVARSRSLKRRRDRHRDRRRRIDTRRCHTGHH